MSEHAGGGPGSGWEMDGDVRHVPSGILLSEGPISPILADKSFGALRRGVRYVS